MAFRELRINDQIRIPQVRLFDDTTQEALGIVAIDRARQLAVERELDLVEVAPQAQPPVCRLMDYGRFKFEALKREKDSKREHNAVRLKEMKLRPKISDNDFRTKYGYVRHFLEDGDKVKLTIMFRGREMVHQEYGRRLLDRMATELKDVAIIERNPLVEGRNMIMIMSPVARKQAKGAPHHHGEPGEPDEGATINGVAEPGEATEDAGATAAVATQDDVPPTSPAEAGSPATTTTSTEPEGRPATATAAEATTAGGARHTRSTSDAQAQDA